MEALPPLTWLFPIHSQLPPTKPTACFRGSVKTQWAQGSQETMIFWGDTASIGTSEETYIHMHSVKNYINSSNLQLILQLQYDDLQLLFLQFVADFRVCEPLKKRFILRDRLRQLSFPQTNQFLQITLNN